MCAEKSDAPEFKVFWDNESKAPSVSYDTENSQNIGGVRRKKNSKAWWIVLFVFLLCSSFLGFVYFKKISSSPDETENRKSQDEYSNKYDEEDMPSDSNSDVPQLILPQPHLILPQ